MRVLALMIAGLLLGVGAAGARAIVGTAGNDRLVGTPRADTLAGLAGSDRISGGAGSDLLLGGPGRDSVDGGPGNDLVSIEYDGARDTARCGTGTDTVNADPLDSVASDCEIVGRRLSRDPYTNPESQHETEVEPDSFTFGRTTVATFQVGRRFDGGATNIGFAVSNDDRCLLAGLETPRDFHAVWDGEGLLALVSAEVEDDLVRVHARHGTRDDFDRHGAAPALERQLEAV